jgi:membrane protease YdiL (CAAX protease family)
MKKLIRIIEIFAMIAVILFNLNIHSEEKNPKIAAGLGIIPGLGQAYLGNYGSASIQFGLFQTFAGLNHQFSSQPDYIPYDQRTVKFDLADAILARSYQNQNIPYNDANSINNILVNQFYGEGIYGESKFERDSRMISNGNLVELNPLIKYGTYNRTNRPTYYSDLMNNPEISTIFYSIYSSHRDANRINDDQGESFQSLAKAPFQWRYISDPKLFVPIIVTLGLGMIPTADPTPNTLAPKSMVQDGTLYAGSFINGISPAIGEEAFFRGMINTQAVNRMGLYPGITTSGLIFSMAHGMNSDFREGFGIRFIGGAYLGYLHAVNQFDLRPGIAMHFWWNFLVGIISIKNYKADPFYSVDQKEAHIIPIVYSFRF